MQRENRENPEHFVSVCCKSSIEVMFTNSYAEVLCIRCGKKLLHNEFRRVPYHFGEPEPVKVKKSEIIVPALFASVVLVAWSLLILLAIYLLFPTSAEAQYANPYGNGRHVAQFQEGFEKECELHWHDDLDILREWQMEGAYWLAQYNSCVEDARVIWFPLIGSRVYSLFLYWPENPTLRSYQVSRNVIEEDFNDPDKYYSRFIDSCNAHVVAGHATETQFAEEVYQIHLNYCHCRQTIGRGVCSADFIKTHPFRYVTYLQE